MQRYRITHGSGFYMVEGLGLADVFNALARSERAQPGRHGGPVTVEYVASADADGRFPLAEA